MTLTLSLWILAALVAVNGHSYGEGFETSPECVEKCPRTDPDDHAYCDESIVQDCDCSSFDDPNCGFSCIHYRWEMFCSENPHEPSFETTSECVPICPDEEPNFNGLCSNRILEGCDCAGDNGECLFTCENDLWTMACAVGTTFETSRECIPKCPVNEPESGTACTSSLLEGCYCASDDQHCFYSCDNDIWNVACAGDPLPTPVPVATPTFFPQFMPEPTVCMTANCAELECCGTGTQWSTERLMCVFNETSTGWNGETRPTDHEICLTRYCAEDGCCSPPSTIYNSTSTYCEPWTNDQDAADAWAAQFFDDYKKNNPNESCAAGCTAAEGASKTLCLECPSCEPMCGNTCRSTHVLCQAAC